MHGDGLHRRIVVLIVVAREPDEFNIGDYDIVTKRASYGPAGVFEDFASCANESIVFPEAPDESD
jgi:hypothetical protein